jgi:hypothetical protein
MDYPTLDTLVQALLAQGHKVEAVKQVHRATGWGLKASKDYVDGLVSRDDSPSLAAEPVDYAAFSEAALLAALEYAGRTPDLDLIRACLARREALTPGLLALLQAEEDADWEDADRDWGEEDPRWYRSVHAGLLLCAFREPAALPIFARLLRDEAQNVLHELFDFALPYYYGPLAVPMLVEMLEVQGDYNYPAIAAAEMLAYLAQHHPEERERVIESLRRHLPALNEEGQLELTAQQRRDPPELWIWIVNAFMELRYEGAHDLVEALFEADLLDTMIFGDWRDYQAAFAPDALPSLSANYAYDILADYEGLRLQEQERKRRAAQAAERALSRRAAEEAGPAPGGPSQLTSSSATPFVRQTPKVGRNDPCPCGSGRKYKHCCGKKG